MEQKEVKELAKTILYIVLVMALGMFLFNQFLEWQFKADLLMNPCKVCLKYNPNLTLTEKPYTISLDDLTEKIKINLTN